MLLVVVLLTLGSLYVLQDQKRFPTKLGLDISGGMQVVLEAKDTEKVMVTPEVMQSIISVVRNRVDGLGVAEPVIQKKGDRQIVVELPGIADPDRARAMIGKTAHLKFQEQGTAAPQAPQAAQAGAPAMPTWVDTGLDGSMLKSAKAEPNPGMGGGWVVTLQFDPQGAKLFGEITSRNVGKPVAMVLDDKVISAPNVNEPILSGDAVISGNFAAKEAQDVAVQLNAGALPVPLEEIENRTVGPTLGSDTVQGAVRAGIVGFALVVLYMIGYYRLPGLVASIALGIYTVLLLAIFHLIPVTLTVPGIAGFILSIGMAVDANVLIFERTKEELRRGRSLYSAIEIGFKRAFTAIFDSNSTTVLTCVILYIFGTGLVRGFALTLALGVIISMFTAITVTRVLLFQILSNKAINQTSYFGVKSPEPNKAS